MGEISALWLRRFADESNKIEGMGRANVRELVALRRFLDQPVIGVADLEHYVAAVAPGHVLRRDPGRNVRVGDYIAPSGGPAIEPALTALLTSAANAIPYHTHVAYEMLHPFTDGNGRSGRALWLWTHIQQGTESRPVALGFLHTFYYETLSFSRPKDTRNAG